MILDVELTASGIVGLIASGFGAGIVAGLLLALVTLLYPGRDTGDV